MVCKRKNAYQCGKNLLAMRDCDCKAKKEAIISCSVGIKDWGHKNKVLFYMCSSAEFHLYSDCMYMLPLAHFVISSHFVCRVSLFSSSVLRLLNMYTVLLLPLAHFVISSLRLMWSDTSSCYCTFMPDKGWTQAALLAGNDSCIMNSIIV